jgi:hypothetical protein
MRTTTFACAFKGLVDAVEHLNGNLGTDHAVITERILASGGDPDEEVDWAMMKETICEEYLAMHLFLHAERCQEIWRSHCQERPERLCDWP